MRYYLSKLAFYYNLTYNTSYWGLTHFSMSCPVMSNEAFQIAFEQFTFLSDTETSNHPLNPTVLFNWWSHYSIQISLYLIFVIMTLICKVIPSLRCITACIWLCMHVYVCVVVNGGCFYFVIVLWDGGETNFR